MIAKYPGTCRLCGKPIKEGAKIKWVAGKGAFHDACPGRCELSGGCIPYNNRQFDTCIGCKEWGMTLDENGNAVKMTSTYNDDNDDQDSARRAEWAAAEAELGSVDY